MSEFVTVHPEIFSRFPQTTLVCVHAAGIDNSIQSDKLKDLYRRYLQIAHAELSNTTEVQSLPEVSCWRETYQAFGAKPSKYRSSIEALLRRVQKDSEPFFINPLVDLYNAISVKYRVPCGAEDLNCISGPLRLVVATGNERGRVLGESEESSCEPGEIAYVDDIGFVCRRWNWREADRTKVTELSSSILFVCEAVQLKFKERCLQAADEFQKLGREFVGGEWTSQVLDATAAEILAPASR